MVRAYNARVHALLLPQSLSRVEASERCRRYLATRIRRFRLAHVCLPRDGRDDWSGLLGGPGLERVIAAQAQGFARRRGLAERASELDGALSERARSPVGIALSFTIRRHGLPEELLRRPLFEWRRDESLAAFETREALVAHARALAAPEGRLLLQLAGAASPRNEVLADSLAVALQLTDWLVDLAGEFERGRLRLPIDELARDGVALDSLHARRAGGGGSALRGRGESTGLARVVARQVAWTRSFYAKGWELCRALGPWRGRELAFVLRWHAASLSALEHARFDALRGPPPSGWLRLLACGVTSLVTPSVPRLA